MEPRSLQFAADACAGRLLEGAPATEVRRVCTDSRSAQAGDLFFALVGEKFDGHQFLAEVAGKGVAAIVVQRNKLAGVPPNCPVIVVEDTRRALGQLAARYRRDFTLPVIAVGGSNGKTTTKELIASVLRQRFVTLWSEASFNNDVGVPVTLLKLERAHQAAVLEVGTNHPGELPPLLEMIQPRFGVITSIGREHLEFFGDLAGVVREEGWVAEKLPAEGRLFINGDTEFIGELVRRSRAPMVRVGLGADHDWRGDVLAIDAGGVRFRVTARRAEFSGEYRVGLLGRHQVTNALLALAVGAELGVTSDEARRGLAECPQPVMRMQCYEAGGVRVLDDAYNANADSMLAALQTLRDLPCSGRRVAVLGDMAELGAQAPDAHDEVGRRAAALGVDRLLTVGPMAQRIAAGARSAGLRDVSEFSEVAAAAQAVKEWVKPGDVVLLKASRSAGFERITAALRQTK